MEDTKDTEGRKHRRWTSEEALRIITLLQAGTEIPEIAKVIDRSENSVSYEIFRYIHEQKKKGFNKGEISDFLNLDEEAVAQILRYSVSNRKRPLIHEDDNPINKRVKLEDEWKKLGDMHTELQKDYKNLEGICMELEKDYNGLLFYNKHLEILLNLEQSKGKLLKSQIDGLKLEINKLKLQVISHEI